MTRRPLFSTYRQGENRVTGSMIAVFERIDSRRYAQFWLGDRGSRHRTDDVSSSAGGFEGDRAGRRDRRRASGTSSRSRPSSELFERMQLRGHLANLPGTASDERLIVVTPDAAEPPP